MSVHGRVEDLVNAALRAVDDLSASSAERAEMLMEIAMGLQQKPKARQDLDAAVTLYRAGLALCATSMPLLHARIGARLATALMAIPSGSAEDLVEARALLERALPVLTADGAGEEVAEAEMNLGLVLQSLAGVNQARIQDAIAAYQRALRTFDRHHHPQEFAILQNNLATAFLSIPFTDERSKLREALAVQAFEEGLAVVNLVDHPNEYAMLQNNLGNALQHVNSSHRLANARRALEAYDEALKVRTRRAAPAEYANTIANKANCLSNLPDDEDNLAAAAALYEEAYQIFDEQGEREKAVNVAEALREIRPEVGVDLPRLAE